MESRNGVLINMIEDENPHYLFSEFETELLLYLEDKVVNGIANNDELTMYENYKWFHEIDFDSDIARGLEREMQNIYENGYK